VAFSTQYAASVVIVCKLELCLLVGRASVYVAEIIMRVGLHICRYDAFEDYPASWHYRFAVVDLDKCKNYPLNFVCMLPTKIIADGKSPSVFLQIFGDKSVEQARALLTGALETESDSEVKAEIERRLKLLEAKPTS
jgi:hypothetical protein